MGQRGPGRRGGRRWRPSSSPGRGWTAARVEVPSGAPCRWRPRRRASAADAASPPPAAPEPGERARRRGRPVTRRELRAPPRARSRRTARRPRRKERRATARPAAAPAPRRRGVAPPTPTPARSCPPRRPEPAVVPAGDANPAAARRRRRPAATVDPAEREFGFERSRAARHRHRTLPPPARAASVALRHQRRTPVAARAGVASVAASRALSPPPRPPAPSSGCPRSARRSSRPDRAT